MKNVLLFAFISMIYCVIVPLNRRGFIISLNDEILYIFLFINALEFLKIADQLVNLLLNTSYSLIAVDSSQFLKDIGYVIEY